jgi:tetratricopeptide (TPR) repeat protein
MAQSNAYPLARAKALAAQADFLWHFEHFTEARIASEECLDLFRACGDKAGEIDGLVNLALVSNVAQQVELNQLALTLAQSLDDKRGQAIVLTQLGWCDSKHTSTYWQEAIDLFRQVGDWVSLAGALAALGNYHIENGKLVPGQEMLDESLRLHQQLSVRYPPEFVLVGYGHLAYSRGDYKQARTLFEINMTIAEDLGFRVRYLWARVRLGYVNLHEGHLTEALNIFAETAREFQKNEYKIGVVFALEGTAALYVAIDKHEYAARLIGWADATRKEISDTRPFLEQADVDKIIAACMVKMGEVAFSDAYDEGHAMTMEQAIELALKNE